MEGRNGVLLAIIVAMLLLNIVPSPSFACPSKGNGCKNCISDQMKYSCPSCVPILQCMSKCLWGGSSQSKCIKKCDCDGGKPRLSDCKKCMGRCKCSCKSS
ncbi:hypothetical protein GIB67_013333 [Kingdonia uniflora]|uniref:Uncharacterized protein n=1 Tax=Kingdonia uniflora TaxID=39325 RepID=A0A7J7LR08_9MAGN|nr:hypothetical protein GIB67_013333 [Kingdonia uniflora]